MQSKAKKTRVSLPYEVVYKTNLDFERTLVSLTEVMKIVPGPNRGIQFLYWKDRETVSCRFGSNGGLQIHSSSPKERNQFIVLLQSRAVYRDGQDPQWKLKKKSKGRAVIEIELAEFKNMAESKKVESFLREHVN